MKKITFKYFIVLVSLILLFSSAVSAALFSHENYENDVNNIINELKMIDSMIDPGADVYNQVKELENLQLKKNCRLTIIQSDGTVLFDSEVSSQLENHLSREEVKEAINTGVGSATRYSSTTNQRMIYGAIKGDSGLILRMSIPSDGVIDYMLVLLPGLAVSILIAMIVGILISQRLAKKLALPLETASKQLSDLQVNHPVTLEENYPYEELNTIAQVTNQLSKTINATVSDLKEETDKIHYLLDHMSEGIMVIDNHSQVILINHVALSILESKINDLNRDIDEYTENDRILEFVFGREKNTMLQIKNSYYSINKNRISDKAFLGSKVFVFVDITDQILNNQMKTLFFSNASHELKTPLTSIQGYTELLTNDMIKDDQMKKQILGKIAIETKRMARLISDILMISKLESQQEQYPVSKIDSKILMEDIMNTLLPSSQDYNVEMIDESEHFTFTSNLEHMNQILTNLLSNSIKYGKNGGYVKLNMKLEGSTLIIKVEDNGIGVAEEEIPHLTERFYRVDKGRSKTTEGTGLGLSIVKHIVQIYDGDMNIESKLGVGTVITIHLKVLE